MTEKHGGTSVQKVEVVVTSAEHPSRIARAVEAEAELLHEPPPFSSGEAATSPQGRLARLENQLNGLTFAVTALEEMLGPMKIISNELRSLTVLSVDDDPLVLAVMRRILVAAGARVLEAAGPVEALAALASEPVHAALVDLRLETEFSGLELCRHIQNTHPEVGIVVMTGLAVQADKDAAKALGVRVLEKPCHNADVIRALLDAHARKPSPP